MPRRGFGSSGRRRRKKGHALLSHSHAPRTYTFHEHAPSSPSSSSSSSERSEPETMQVGVTALGRTGTAAQNNTNPRVPVTTWREWAFGTAGKRRNRRSAAYKSRKRNRRRH